MNTVLMMLKLLGKIQFFAYLIEFIYFSIPFLRDILALKLIALNNFLLSEKIPN